MRWRVLGPVGAAAGDRRTDLGGDRQRTIAAALLAARGEAVTTDRLIDGLWGPRPPPSARKTLQSYVSRLRSELRGLDPDAADAVASTADGYRLDPGAGEFDADDFEALLTEVQRPGISEPAQLIHVLREAEDLWEGPAFGELASHELVREEAHRLERLRAAAIADRIDAQLALGQHGQVIGELEAAVARDPLNERIRGQLMLALYRGGHQAEALATYRRLQEELREEVGIDPSDELQALHEQILQQQAELWAPLQRGEPGPAPSPPTSPPQRRGATAHRAVAAPLIGREHDRAKLRELVGNTRLVTLVGPGGVGKTRLAEQVASDVGDELPEGTASCQLAAIRDPGDVVTAAIDALGARHRGGQPAEETLLAALSTRRLLLVIDNCEHLLTSVSPLVESILAACPNVSVLTTSREPLRLPTERVWQLAPLAVPGQHARRDEVTRSPAGALLVARAQTAEPTFELTEANAAAVAQLCRRLDGIPLAIELAAARLRAIGVDDLLARLDRRFELLTGGPHREDGRHRTLEAVVRWSYDALEHEEARLFERLSVFAGAFELDAVERICARPPIREAQIAGLLAELVDKSMVVVQHDEDRTRYRLLDTLREFGAERLEELGETQHLQQSHASYHVAFAEEIGPHVRGADERTALSRIDGAIDDLRVAHAWLVERSAVDEALRLPVALRDYIGHRQRDEMFWWTERALELPDAAARAAYPAALATAARGATRRGDLERSRSYAEAALAEVEPVSLTATWAMQALATTALYEGRLEDVLTLTGNWPGLPNDPGEDHYRAMNSMLRVLAHTYRGDGASAAVEADALLVAARNSRNDTVLAYALYSQGEALLETDPDAARSHLEGAIEAARRVEGRAAAGIAMVSLASLHGRTGEEERAIDLFAEVISHWRRLGDWTHQLTTLRNLVELLVRVGADESAALLHGAVRDAAPPSFGDEAARMDDAWAQLEERLGPDTAADLANRGRQLRSPEVVDTALAILAELTAE